MDHAVRCSSGDLCLCITDGFYVYDLDWRLTNKTTTSEYFVFLSVEKSPSSNNRFAHVFSITRCRLCLVGLKGYVPVSQA